MVLTEPVMRTSHYFLVMIHYYYLIDYVTISFHPHDCDLWEIHKGLYDKNI